MDNTTEIKQIQDEIIKLKLVLREKEEILRKLKQTQPNQNNNIYADGLSKDEVTRYSRQMIMSQITKNGQIKLKRSKVLIVGAGGLGCPAALYLAAAGIGQIDVVDYDTVELSNLHRQILHTEADIGVPKDASAAEKLTRINSNIQINPLHFLADSKSLVEYIKTNKYNVVIDCSDNVPTRYLLNDVCVLHNVPLVSGSALQMEGQLTVYNYKNGPCYRCIFPVPPPAETITNCGDGGVLGVVPGVIGVLQALEAIKIIAEIDGVLAGRLLLFDGNETTFRNVKLRGKMANCAVCGNEPTITELINYEQFCGSRSHDKIINIHILNKNEQIEVREFAKLLENQKETIVAIDVRPELEYKMCHLPLTINLSYPKITTDGGVQELKKIIKNNSKVYVLCRRGNDSQRAITALKERFSDGSVKFWNVSGGLYAYAELVDPKFPIY